MSERAVGDYLIELGYVGAWNCGEGGTAQECWDNLVLKNLKSEVIPTLVGSINKDAFISRVNELKNEYTLKQVREKRTSLLAECDWVVLSDVSKTNIDEWKTYRQALRDLPASITDFDAEVIYPVIPK